MKKFLCSAALVFGIFASAQDHSAVSDTVKHWSVKGQNTLMLNQAAFSNWVGGGANNIGWIAGSNYNITYEKGHDLLENIVILGYGQTNTKGIGTRKTQDLINLSSNYGRKISENWYLSAGASLLTQFAPGYDYATSSSIASKGTDNEGHKKISSFMAPGYVNLGAGFTYRPNDRFTMTLRPTNARWTFVLDKDLQYAGNYGLKNDGDSSLFQFGFLGTALYKVQLMENMSLINTASVFSNYLDHPERLVLSYGGILNMIVNKYISTVLTLDLFYDHNQVRKTQLKQTLGVGFAYNIDNGVKRSENKNNQTWK
ncbi:DUF3078 domain-containing protein [Bergeyella sp. RCAD1439]|uniref:DUF3078 domain-containing protein n=1 Tax=Bergeyella anatis TaxID=3113737 RepID=UPI002E199783|nr:DUF3078 domain-containing protein [Bergeyella sp. RCAD1439]